MMITLCGGVLFHSHVIAMLSREMVDGSTAAAGGCHLPLMSSMVDGRLGMVGGGGYRWICTIVEVEVSEM